MAVMQLIYMSQPFGFDAAMLNAILLTSRRNNARDDITGALVVRSDIYLQLLEGPQAAIELAFDRIAGDDRHLDVTRLWSGDVAERLFPAWAMRDDPARSWLWPAVEVAAGAVTAAPPASLRAVFRRVAEDAA